MSSKAYHSIHIKTPMKKWVEENEGKKRKRKLYSKLSEKTPNDFSNEIDFSPEVVGFIKENMEDQNRYIKNIRSV